MNKKFVVRDGLETFDSSADDGVEKVRVQYFDKNKKLCEVAISLVTYEMLLRTPASLSLLVQGFLAGS